MRGTTRRKNRQPTLLQDDSGGGGSSNGGKATPVPSPGPPEEWRLEAAIVALLMLTDGDNRLVCPPFRVLPTPAEFPLYYEHIKHPIDLKCIAERVRTGGHYADWASLEADIQLMCQNAKNFHESGATVRKDADLLLAQFRSRASDLMGARRFSARVLARNKEYIDDLLRSSSSEVDAYSEDSEEDEDSERSDDPKWRLYWTVRNFDVVDGVPLCENFMELPSKRSYPDYYEETERPMSLYMINKKLKRDQYGVGPQQQLHGLVQDLLLMFDNACAYNIEESEIYEAAQRLRKLTLQTARKLDNNASKWATQKAVKQEVLEVDEDAADVDGGGGGGRAAEKQRNHSKAAPVLPKMNGTNAVAVAPPAAKRRKIAAAPAAPTAAVAAAVVPIRRLLKREASTKGQQAIKRMVESDFEEDDYFADDDADGVDRNVGDFVHQSVNSCMPPPPTCSSSINGTAGADFAATAPSSASSSSSSTAPPLPVTTTKQNVNKNQRTAVPSSPTAPRRLNADGTPAERLKPGRKSVDELREKFAQKLTAVWQDVHNLKMGNRSLAEPFQYLPCDKTFPDYYRTIARPISLDCIQRKIKDQQYADSDQLLADLRQMFANARAFNKPGAQICTDATILESVAVGSLHIHTEGVTLFYPYRRTDKGWTEKASIEKSPLKMKRKGAIVGSTTTTSSGTTTNNKSSPTDAAVVAVSAASIATAAIALSSSTTSQTGNMATTAPQPPSATSSFVHSAAAAPPAAAQCCPNAILPSTSVAGATSAYYAGDNNFAQPPPQPLTTTAMSLPQHYHHQVHAQQHAFAAATQQSVGGAQQQQHIIVHHQQPQHVAAKHQQYFPSSSATTLALMNGMPPNKTLRQVLHNGAIAGFCVVPAAAAAPSSCCSTAQHHQQPAAAGGGDVQSMPSAATVVAAPPAVPQQQHHQLPGTSSSTHTVAATASTMLIDPGRSVVSATPRTVEPVFVEPSTSLKVQRVLHSEAYVRYIESMYGGGAAGGNNKLPQQRTVSKWDSNLQATQRNTATTSAAGANTAPAALVGAIKNSSANRRQLAQEWIRLSANGSKHREEQLMQALWKLRDRLIESTIDVARPAELTAADVPPTATTRTTTAKTVPTLPSTSSSGAAANGGTAAGASV